MGIAMDIGLRRDGVGILTLSNASTGAGVSFAAPTLIAGSGVSSATPATGTVTATAGLGAAVAGAAIRLAAGKSGDAATAGGNVILVCR